LREHTAGFFHRCVDYFLDNPNATKQMRDQSWFLERFNGDITIRNLFGNYTVIQNLLSLLPDTQSLSLYEYLEDLVECWYFDTNESAQGEELYLYLNARGESIADNENLKAQLLAGVGDTTKKDVWGRTWEEWQDYFWQNRKIGLSENTDNPNADRGFNCFLGCIENLEKLRTKGAEVTEMINLITINTYLCILRWLENEKDRFKALYLYAGWIDRWFSEMWGIFNQPDGTEWAASLNDENKSTAHNRMVLLWGSLMCVACALEKNNGALEKLDPQPVFRAIRIFYLRYCNSSRAVATLPKTIMGILDENPDVFGEEGTEERVEERVKWDFLKGRPENERRELESLIWKIEDHPFNQDGSDLGGKHISHLVNLAVDATGISQLKKIQNAFYGLFPTEKNGRDQSDDNAQKVALALLYYGIFWNRVSPWYYENYNLRDWRRTIRGKGNQETTAKDISGPVFRRFFDEFVNAGYSLDQFLEQKKNSVSVEPKSEMDMRNALIWYSENSKAGIFGKGMFIVTRSSEEEPDAHFPKLPALWNTRGDFRKTDEYQKMADLIH
jgi:hypothetical protein